MKIAPTRLVMLCLATLAVLSVPARAQEEQDRAWETRLHDVSDLAPHRGAPMRRDVGAGTPFQVWTSHYNPSEFSGPLREASVSHSFSIDQIVSLVASFVNEVDEFALVDEASGCVRVRAGDTGQERASAALDVLRRAAGGPVRVEVEEFVLPEGVDVTALPDAGTVAAWREHDVRGRPRLLGLSLDPGCWRSAEDVEGVRGIVDVDVEIAQDSQIADPIVVRIDEGVRITAIAHPLGDGRVVMRVLVGGAQLRGTPRRVALGEDELGAVDLADLEGAFASTELVLAAGVADTIVMTRPNGSRRVLVFRLAEAPDAPVGGTLRVLPYGALTAVMPRVSLATSAGPWRDGRPWFALQVSEDEEDYRLDRDVVREVLESQITKELEDGTAEVSAVEWMRGGAFVMRAASDSLDRVETRLRRLEAEAVRHARLTIRLEERPLGGGEPRVVSVLASQVPLGMASALGAYRSAAYLEDQDVEVAEKARISDPIIGSTLAGALANVVVSSAGERSYSVALELRAMEFDEPELLPFTALNVGPVERLVERAAYTESRVRVTRGRSMDVLIGSSPFSAEPARLVAVITVE